MNQDDTELWNMLGKARRKKAPEGFAASVMERITLESQVLRKPNHMRWVPLGAAAAALIGAVALVAQMFSPVSVSDDGMIASIDDEVLLDFAYESLGYESLQDAVCSVSSPDVDNLGEHELTNMSF